MRQAQKLRIVCPFASQVCTFCKLDSKELPANKLISQKYKQSNSTTGVLKCGFPVYLASAWRFLSVCNLFRTEKGCVKEHDCCTLNVPHYGHNQNSLRYFVTILWVHGMAQTFDPICKYFIWARNKCWVKWSRGSKHNGSTKNNKM